MSSVSTIMLSDRAPLQCLNLSVNYVSHWTYLQGLREIYQNFMDACVQKYPQYRLLHKKNPDTNTTIFTQAKRAGNMLDEKVGNYISYNKNTKTLILENQKSFPIKCLLMGCSEKGPEALGQFGEGMKVAMIVLLKADIDIIIESGENIYYPTTKTWDHNSLLQGKYDKNVLYVKVQAKKFQDKTKVIIQNIDQAKFNQFLYLSLALLDQNSYDMLTFGGSTLILPKDPKLIGKVYKKGVRLQLHQSKNSVKFQHYSYNFESIQVGRQRDCVNNVWDLYRLQSQLHYNVILRSLDKNFLANNPQLKPKFRQHINNIYNYLQAHNYQVHFFHEYARPNKPVCDIIYDKFLSENNNPPQLYPQHGEVLYQISNKLKIYGLHPQFYPAISVGYLTWLTLPYSTKYISVDNKIKRDILDKQMRQLNEQQRNKMKAISDKIATLFPQINQYGFKVKQFKQIICCKDNLPNVKIMYINTAYLDQPDKIIRQICKMLLQ